MTVLYSILHLLVDGLCAMAMFGRYLPMEYGYIYIWFCYLPESCICRDVVLNS